MRAQFSIRITQEGPYAEARKLRLLSCRLATWSRRTCILSLVLIISNSGGGDSDRVALAEIDVSKVGASVRIASPAAVSKSRRSPRLFHFLGSTKLADSGPFILESPHIPCWREAAREEWLRSYLGIGSQGSASELKPAHPIVQCRFVTNKHADRQPSFLKSTAARFVLPIAAAVATEPLLACLRVSRPAPELGRGSVPGNNQGAERSTLRLEI